MSLAAPSRKGPNTSFLEVPVAPSRAVADPPEIDLFTLQKNNWSTALPSPVKNPLTNILFEVDLGVIVQVIAESVHWLLPGIDTVPIAVLAASPVVAT